MRLVKPAPLSFAVKDRRIAQMPDNNLKVSAPTAGTVKKEVNFLPAIEEHNPPSRKINVF